MAKIWTAKADREDSKAIHLPFIAETLRRAAPLRDNCRQ
jgi:hypothetical protein